MHKRIYFRLLKNLPLEAGDIYSYYKKNKRFKGVYSIHSHLPNIRRYQFIICNLDYPRNEGTHWTGLFKLNSKKYFWIDPFGVNPPDPIMKRYKHVVYQNEDIQELKSNRCGGFVIRIIDKLIEGYTPRAIINSFTQNGSLYNEWMVISHFKY